VEHVAMSLIITGASGELGRRTAELLLKTDGVDPADVVLVTRSTDKLADLAARGAQVRRGDFDDPATLPGAFAGATRVLVISTTEIGTEAGGQRGQVPGRCRRPAGTTRACPAGQAMTTIRRKQS
jgi:NAD(P)H dehydrogenase (quinone)